MQFLSLETEQPPRFYDSNCAVRKDNDFRQEKDHSLQPKPRSSGLCHLVFVPLGTLVHGGEKIGGRMPKVSSILCLMTKNEIH